jgi:hypothetical protein
MTMTTQNNTMFFDSLTSVDSVELDTLMCNAVSALINKQGLTAENRALAARTIRTIADNQRDRRNIN